MRRTGVMVITVLALGFALWTASLNAEEAATNDTAKTTETDGTKKKKVRYKAGKRHDFDATNIDGKVRKPEISIVTGGERTNDNGLLRLRENWLDRLTIYSGEELQ